MIWYQLALVVLLAMSFFGMVYRDFNGRPALAPRGFQGFIATILAFSLSGFIYYKAGMFSEIIKTIFP